MRLVRALNRNNGIRRIIRVEAEVLVNPEFILQDHVTFCRKIGDHAALGDGMPDTDDVITGGSPYS